MNDEATGEGRGLQTRWVELVFGLLFVLAGAVVVYDSSRIGAQWGTEGPQAGYFPWLTGFSMLLAGAWIAGQTLWRWKRIGDEVFVSWARLRPVLSMLLPSAGFVLLIHFLGIYVSAAIFIAAFMLWKGHYGILPALGVALGVPIVMFLLFEVWFLVPLPKGPLEAMLGF